MNCRFLDNFSLKTFLSPVTEEMFRSQHWERAPLVFRRSDPSYYDNLFTLEDFDRQISTAPAKIVTMEAKSKAYTRYREDTGFIPFEHVLTEMRDGMTLLLEHQHRREEKLGLLCRLLEQHFSHRFEANLYLTPPNGQGLLPHWDNHDTFVMQVAGSKHWKVEKQRRRLPGRTEQISDPNREIVPGSHAFTLNQGDMIYIPRGTMHAAECGAEASLHITVGVRIYAWDELLEAVIARAVREDESLRHALPFGFLRDGGDLTGPLAAALRKAADEHFVAGVVERFKDAVVTRATLDISGQVKAFMQPAQLRAEDKVGPRPAIVYRLHSGDDSVRLNFGSRSIMFPTYFRKALEFALSTPIYAIRDIAGELEESEKLVFTERLIEEGLVVRK